MALLRLVAPLSNVPKGILGQVIGKIKLFPSSVFIALF